MSPLLRFALLRSKAAAFTRRFTQRSNAVNIPAIVRPSNIRDSESMNIGMPRIGTTLRQSFVRRSSALYNSLAARLPVGKAGAVMDADVEDDTLSSASMSVAATVLPAGSSAAQNLDMDEEDEVISSCPSMYGSSCSSDLVCLGARSLKAGGINHAQDPNISRPALMPSANKADVLISRHERCQHRYWLRSAKQGRQMFDGRESRAIKDEVRSRFVARQLAKGGQLTAKNLSKVKKANGSPAYRAERWAKKHKVCKQDFVHLHLEPGATPGERNFLTWDNLLKMPSLSLTPSERTAQWVQGQQSL